MNPDLYAKTLLQNQRRREGVICIPVGEALMNINNLTVSSVTLSLEFVRIDSGMTATLKGGLRVLS